ncbi:hypothetical protein [Photorhabdus asymbiotica]|uniref:hypothetical protein n=1 Tax=Photorhabdus asymbiotica TaxID=291112 RepID=UPI003DA78206
MTDIRYLPCTSDLSTTGYNMPSQLNNFPKWCYTLSTNNPMYNNGLKKTTCSGIMKPYLDKNTDSNGDRQAWGRNAILDE